MKNFLTIFAGVFLGLFTQVCYAVDKYDILPDLPEPLAAAQASSVSTTDAAATLATQPIGQEPNFFSMIFSLIFVILLIYVTGILYTKLNKFGVKALKGQQGDVRASQVSVVSTTPLGNNKTLHVVELDGKRMLIGASSTAIQLIKDLGFSNEASQDEDYSHIEIPNIKIPKIEIPKIEIPKIEIPSIDFSKLVTKIHKPMSEFVESNIANEIGSKGKSTEQNDISKCNNSEVIIDSLFAQQQEVEQLQTVDESTTNTEHIVDPEDFSLYKKYLA